MRTFTREELRRYNGQNGAPVYIACAGKVYDVSQSFLWRNGTHQVTHRAGEDLTAALDRAPHSAELLARFPVIGLLRDEYDEGK